MFWRVSRHGLPNLTPSRRDYGHLVFSLPPNLHTFAHYRDEPYLSCRVSGVASAPDVRSVLNQVTEEVLA
jgi:hypothetical protein